MPLPSAIFSISFTAPRILKRISSTAPLLHALTFGQRNCTVNARNIKCFGRAVGPLHFEAVNFIRRAEAEEEAAVVLRRVAAAADNVAALAKLPRGDVDDCADGVARAFARG